MNVVFTVQVLPCVHIFFLGLMLCRSALFIENYIKRLYRLRRCFLFTQILGAPTEPGTSNADFSTNRMLLWSKKAFLFIKIFYNFLSPHICVHTVGTNVRSKRSIIVIPCLLAKRRKKEMRVYARISISDLYFPIWLGYFIECRNI